MKSPLLVFAAVAGIWLPLVSAGQAPRQPMRDAATHDQIVEAAAQAGRDAPPPDFQPAEGPDPSLVHRPQDLLSRSAIFCFQGQATLVPKRAVLHFPDELSARAVLQDPSRFVPWRDFLAANRAWIRTVPVSRAQAEGKQPLDEETVKSLAKERRLVIATYQEGPISVNPPRTPTPGASVATGESTNTPNSHLAPKP